MYISLAVQTFLLYMEHDGFEAKRGESACVNQLSKPCGSSVVYPLHQGQTVCDVNGFPIGEDMLGVEVDPVQDRACGFPSFDI